METPKRKYQKQKIDGKITVKHFLNTRLKGKVQSDSSIAYPLYIRIMVKGQQSDIKSRITGLIQLENFEWFTTEYKQLLAQEIREITSIVESLNPFDKQSFKIQVVTALYSQSVTPFTTIVEDCLKDEIRYCIVRNDPNTPKDTNFDDLGTLSILAQDNPLVSLIDWHKPAYTILTMLQEVIPSLAPYLQTLERNYGAAFTFDSLYNALYAVHRYPAKPTLNDWNTGDLKYQVNNDSAVLQIDQLLKSHYKA